MALLGNGISSGSAWATAFKPSNFGNIEPFVVSISIGGPKGVPTRSIGGPKHVPIESSSTIESLGSSTEMTLDSVLSTIVIEPRLYVWLEFVSKLDRKIIISNLFNSFTYSVNLFQVFTLTECINSVYLGWQLYCYASPFPMHCRPTSGLPQKLNQFH